MVWSLGIPDQGKFFLEHATCRPAPTNAIRVRIKTSEILAQGFVLPTLELQAQENGCLP